MNWEEREIQKAVERTPVAPDACPTCGGELSEGGGMVGELVLYCPKDGPVWEDHADAIRRVI